MQQENCYMCISGCSIKQGQCCKIEQALRWQTALLPGTVGAVLLKNFDNGQGSASLLPLDPRSGQRIVVAGPMVPVSFIPDKSACMPPQRMLRTTAGLARESSRMRRFLKRLLRARPPRCVVQHAAPIASPLRLAADGENRARPCRRTPPSTCWVRRSRPALHLPTCAANGMIDLCLAAFAAIPQR